MAKPKPKTKAPPSRHTDIRVRVTDDEREMIEQAAAADGLATSSWMRALAIKAAKART